MIESNFDSEILSKAKEHKVSLLVVGDPFCHNSHELIPSLCSCREVNNASILNTFDIT